MIQPLAGVTVAITRPADQAKALSAGVQAAGGQVVLFPLIDIVGLDDLSLYRQTLQQASYDWVLFISSNAVTHGLPPLLQHGISPSTRFAAIGPVTASALQQQGIAAVLTPLQRFDSEALLALPEFQAMHGQRVLIVRGIGGRELLADTLRARGAEVVFGECYRRINPQSSLALLQQAFTRGALQAMVITSSEALRHLCQLSALHAPALPDWLKTLPLCVNHARIAEQASAAGLRAYCAEAPGDPAMLALLTSLFTPTASV